MPIWLISKNKNIVDTLIPTQSVNVWSRWICNMYFFLNFKHSDLSDRWLKSSTIPILYKIRFQANLDDLEAFEMKFWFRDPGSWKATSDYFKRKAHVYITRVTNVKVCPKKQMTQRQVDFFTKNCFQIEAIDGLSWHIII